MFENSLRTDEYDVFKIGQGQLAWVSFLDGMQRVLLFTNQPLLAQQLAKTTGMGNTFEKSSLRVAFFLRANFLVNTAYVYSWVFSTIVFHQSISL